MSQVSRPFQIALAAVLLFGVAWFAVLKHHSETGSTGGSGTSTPITSTPRSQAPSTTSPSSTTPSTTSPSTPAPTTGSTEASGGTGENAQERAAKHTHVYKGAAPGLEGLTRDVRKAHEAAGAEERQASEAAHASVEGGSASRAGIPSAAGAAGSKAPSGAGTGANGTATGAGAGTATRTGAGAGTATRTGAGSANGTAGGSATHAASPPGRSGHSAGTTHANRSPAMRVAAQLHEGRTVLILFWNPHASTDIAVHGQVQAVARNLGHSVATNFAKASEVGAFGTVTRDVSVNETPTLLVIDKHGLVTTMSGLTDAFAIEQAIREVRAGNG